MNLVSTSILFLLIHSIYSISLHVNVSRLVSDIQALSLHNDLTPPSVQRILFTPSDLSARSFLISLFQSANLSTHVDALGNIFAVYPGTHDLAPIATGSHIDAIPHSGMYDGVYGVLGALEALRSLQYIGFKPKRPIHILVFTSEEPTRFNLGCLGSRVLTSALNLSALQSLVDRDGITLDEARRHAGLTEPLHSVPLSPGHYHSFIELHIEQAASLEKSGTNIGAVTAIAAPAQMKVTLRGPGGHAGALAMRLRKDPLVAAAQMIAEVEDTAKNGGEYSVATVGKLEVFPGAVNSVPREVHVGIDVRDIDLGSRDSMVERITTEAEKAAEERGVEVEVELVNRDDPVKCSDRIIEAVEKAAEEEELSVMRLVSRAYHDSLFMGRMFDVGMIFVPCKGGISHRPEEFVETKDLKNGVATLARVLIRLADESDVGENEREEL